MFTPYVQVYSRWLPRDKLNPLFSQFISVDSGDLVLGLLADALVGLLVLLYIALASSDSS